MSETQVDHTTCCCSGCPMNGSMSRSTTGGTDWYCFIHFAAAPSHQHLVTLELSRLAWLVDIVRGLRALPRAKNWPQLEADANRQMSLCQRTDLQMSERENPISWMIRLEGVLQQSCKDSIVQ